MGESAGAVSVGHLVNTMPTDPPFRACVEMSGSSVVSAPQVGESNPDAAWPILLRHLNCHNSTNEAVLACLRAVPARTIQRVLNENELIFNAATLDNITALAGPDVAWANGTVAKVPLMIGSTKNDGSLFVRDFALQADALNVNISTLLTQLQVSKEQIELILRLYGPDSPYGNFSTAGDILRAYATDSTFRCTSGFVANLTSSILQVPVWQYVFDALVPGNTWEQYPDLGVYHASELPLVFGTYRRENSTRLEAALSRSMQKQFANFVKDPYRGPGWANWPEIGILAVDRGNVSTTTEDVRKLDAICQVYNLVYGAQLPALFAAKAIA
jgi:carboxylesterase type B